VELAEELLEEAIELEEEEARMLEGIDVVSDDEGDVDSEKRIEMVNKEVNEDSEKEGGKSGVKFSTDTATEDAATEQTPLKTSQSSKRIDIFNPDKQ
jgi:hypothetical protein